MSMPENVLPESQWTILANAEPSAGPSAAPRRVAGTWRPDPVWKLVLLGTLFGVLSGPFLSAAVNHGRPVRGVLGGGPFLLLFGYWFTRVLVARDLPPWRPAALRAVAVIAGGGILFMLPHSLLLPAIGDFWWRTEAERLAVYCVPYPFVAWLVFSRARNRWVPITACVVVAACLAVAWPKLTVGARAQTAALLHMEIGVPAASIYTVGIAGAHPLDGYFVDDGAVSIAYVVHGIGHPTGTYTSTSTFSDGSPPSVDTRPVYLGYDLALTVYSAKTNGPCGGFEDALENVLPDGFGGGTFATCKQLPNGRWQYSENVDPAHLTQVERVGDYYIALTVNLQERTLVAQFPQLFAGLHHPSTDEFVAIGLSGNTPDDD